MSAKSNHVTLTIANIMDWQEQDIAVLTKWVNAYANLLGHHQEKAAIQCVRTAIAVEYGANTDDIKQWLSAALRLIFYELVLIMRQYGDANLNAKLDKLEKNFTPYIDIVSSRFGNCFDEIDFEQSSVEILAQARIVIEQS